MQNMPKNKLSLRLAIVAITLSFIATVVWQLGDIGDAILLICSSVLLVARVVAEWQRPRAEWMRGLGVSVLVFIAFGLIMPAWAKVAQQHGVTVHEQLGYLLLVPILANLLVPIVKPFAKGRA